MIRHSRRSRPLCSASGVQFRALLSSCEACSQGATPERDVETRPIVPTRFMSRRRQVVIVGPIGVLTRSSCGAPQRGRRGTTRVGFNRARVVFAGLMMGGADVAVESEAVTLRRE